MHTLTIRNWATRCAFFCALTGAYDASAQCGNADVEADISIYYVNGMFTEYEDAVFYAAYLKLKLSRETGLSGQKYDVFPSYNRNEAMSEQLKQVVAQKGTEYLSEMYLWLEKSELAPAWFKTAVQDLAVSADAAGYVEDDDLQGHVNSYRRDILEGRKVVLVAHSQGNFYANRAYQLVGSLSVGVVAVATPSNTTAGSGPYVNLTTDDIVTHIPGARTANTTNTSPKGDRWGHGFLTSYLMGNVSGPKIMTYVKSHMTSLPAPIQLANNGVITVTLEWGSQPDVDLHVFEPNGTHVYYSHKQGTSGYLDIDDVNGYGPEHYYVGCEDLLTGSYDVGVNYYSGNAPETARIQVVAGDKIRNYTYYLASARGTSGNALPHPIATITVTKPANGNYQFSVASLLPLSKTTPVDLKTFEENKRRIPPEMFIK